MLAVSPGVAGAECADPAQTPAQVRSAPPEEGEPLTLRGVVAARFGGAEALDGFYLQQDGPRAGVFVYTLNGR
ncbi:MAG: hypothetical protein U5L11_05880 [Arhodomonas sp.]|nr:hypothetical protein [Arhodomonas sp.]